MTDAFQVIMGAIGYFFASGFYYLITKKQWLRSWNLDENAVNRRDPIPYLVAFIGSLWTSYGLFTILKHVQPKNLVELMLVSLGTWLFVVVGTSIKHYTFAGVSFKAFLIDYVGDGIGYALICLIIWT